MSDATELTTALHVLDDLGAILWFDSDAGILSKTVFLSPKFAIDFIRQVVNHKLVDEVYIATMNDRWRDLYHRVREEGCVEHELLQRLELWREVDDADLLLELKLLMFELQLAYPTGVEGIKADSDLIVPLYWKKSAPSSTVFGSRSVVNTSWLYRVRWEYEFQGLPDNKGGVGPQWETQWFWVDLGSCGGVSALTGLTLYFVVKTAGMLPKTSILITEGSYRLHDVFNSKVGIDGKSEDMNLGLTSKEAHAGVLHFKMQQST